MRSALHALDAKTRKEAIMRRRRKKADLRIVIRDEEIKIRKTAVRPGQAHQNKKLYSRRNEKRCYEEIPGHDWPGISLYGGIARFWLYCG